MLKRVLKRVPEDTMGHRRSQYYRLYLEIS